MDAAVNRDIVPLYGPEQGLGPKMRALTPLQRNFVICLSQRATRNNTDALRAAGYQGQLVKQHAYALAHNEKVQEALIEENRRRVKNMVPAAVEELAALLDNPQLGATEKLKVITTVLDRAGMHAISESKTTVEHIGQDNDLLKASASLAATLGLDLSALIGARLAAREKAKKPEQIEATDADYEEVPMITIEDLI